MACNLSTEFLCNSINNLKMVEYGATVVVLILIFMIIMNTIFHVLKNGPLAKRMWIYVVGLTPFFLWKTLGIYVMLFIDEASASYAFLNGLVTVLEAFTVVGIAGSLFYMFLLLRAAERTASKKVTRSEEEKTKAVQQVTT